ncbi:uncharacterized protein [Musca autumnalis]|uniref:uncharacterized protein n=1 Tax=Musca autumnalis TaxID=221902 RepID=UPI003CF5625B
MAAHFCGFIKFIFLLLMLARILPTGETRPLKNKSTTSSDLIAGNEFLKLFMGHEELEREFRPRRNDEGAEFKESEEFDKKSAETGRNREAGSRSLKIQGPKINHAEGQLENSKAASSGSSRISFLEDYDENDAILDAEARDIDLKKENTKAKKDDYKVLSISVSSSSSASVGSPASSSSSSASSSSQRGSMVVKNRMTTTTSKYDNKSYTTTTQSVVTMTPRPPTATTYRPTTTTATFPVITTTQKPQTTTMKPLKTPGQTSAAAAASSTSTAGDNFINRSHKSEFSVEEVQPSTARHQQQLVQQQNRQRKVVRKTFTRHHHHQAHQPHHSSYPLTSGADSMEALDSENSASTNVVQNIVASPGQQGSSTPLRSTSTVTTMFHSGQHNVSINHAMSKTQQTAHQTNVDVDISKDLNDQQQSATGVDDQLLPFQTVIYHDTKSGGNSHGPQSRSISYSSISQNVEDLKKWHQSGILAEARRNVSESLKPLPPSAHQSEPAKFYSQPSKMYSEPSKFYSEPSKVYSEPAKVYGEPEKFYSEPAKVYGQPSKFYSEPSKVYSEPAKMYGEPAKTYWPLTVTTTARTTTTIRPITTTNLPQIVTTTTPTPIGLGYPVSRKPAAIVSRIAFGEAQSSSTSTTTASSPTFGTTTTPLPIPMTSTVKSLPSFGGSGFHQRTFGHHRQSPSGGISETTTPPRRILFNLDRLPYDLLNAPQPATQQTPTHLELPQQPPALTYQQQQQQHQPQAQQNQHQQQRHHNINPCLESAVSSLFSSATLSAHPALIKQRQQHSSLSDQQHSNQNAKGLPNEDLVRCVAGISNPSIPSTGTADDNAGLPYTTERSNIEELFTPTPEQNYEIEESASVMTNGRAHGVQGSGGGNRNSLTLPTPQPAAHTFQTNKQRIHFGTNINDGVGGSGGGGTESGYLNQQSSFNDNANAPPHRNLHADGNPSPDYNAYDDGGGNDDYTDDDTGQHRAPGTSNGDGDDSKVAYVVEGRNYRKYRVETKTDDGYIVGEYGVVHHDDGNLRGVRYTADINNTDRRLIQKALLTFLKL